MIYMNTTLFTGHFHVGYLNESFLNSNMCSSNLPNDFSNFVITKDRDLGMNNKEKSDKSWIELELNFWDLSKDIRLNLDSEFCKKLFDSCKLDFHSLAEQLNVTYPFLNHLRRNMYSIPLSKILKLSKLSNMPLNKIQDNISSIRARGGTEINIPLPIKANKTIASLVGHVFGDGYIGKTRKYFEYCNFNPKLIEQVKKQILESFGLYPMSERKDRIGYPTIVGEILRIFGAPEAPKIYSPNLVPKWILQSKEHQKSFLRAFFDDDGSVMYSKNYNAKGINLNVIRHINQKEELLTLLNQIKVMLSNFEIYSGNPIISKTYKKQDGIHIIGYINITDYQSIINFNKFIGLTFGEKYKKLIKIVNRKNYYNKKNEININNEILTLLLKKNYSTAEIANVIQKSKTKTLKKMNLLKKKNLVEICGKVAANRSYLWKIKGR
ncbi:hypothetical protein JW930_06715 [Candidatus Woesearchaeota archaeon]|nr:hypothetical protein [Candidatus Woesearchaeota archaeon]